MTPAGTSNELDVQNGWEENTHILNSLQGNAVCVSEFSSHPFWTSSSLDVPAGVSQEEGHTGFLIHLLSAVRDAPQFFSREGVSHSFPSSTVKSNFVY